MAKATVEKYRVHPRRPASPSRRVFSKNHVTEIVALGFFTVPAVGFKALFVLILLGQARRKVLHFNVTKHLAVRWTTQQPVEAFPREAAPKHLLRGRDGVCGGRFQRRVASVGIEVVAFPEVGGLHRHYERSAA